MKTYYVETTETVRIQYLVKAKSKKEAVQLTKDWETDSLTIIEFLDDHIEVDEVWIYSK